jgi:hypothetical protein
MVESSANNSARERFAKKKWSSSGERARRAASPTDKYFPKSETERVSGSVDSQRVYGNDHHEESYQTKLRPRECVLPSGSVWLRRPCLLGFFTFVRFGAHTRTSHSTASINIAVLSCSGDPSGNKPREAAR